MKKSALGFTLVELLVVITIIAILSVVGITVFTGTQQNARDARRKTDIDAIANALEVHYNSGTGTYPTALDCTWFAGGTSASAGCPVDPLNSGANVYTNTLAAGSFTTCAHMESNTGGNYNNNTGGTATPNGPYYCRKNQQG